MSVEPRMIASTRRGSVILDPLPLSLDRFVIAGTRFAFRDNPIMDIAPQSSSDLAHCDGGIIRG
jgi:hypothetical protein